MSAYQITQTITDPGTAPARTDPDNFDARADSFLAVLSAWGAAGTGDLNVLVTQLNALSTAVNGYSTSAAASEIAAVAAANFKGSWSSLTGAAAIPYSVLHSSKYWMLNTGLADVTAKEPGVDVEWTEIGNVNINLPNEYAKTQNFNATTLTDAANISWDLESNQVCKVTLAGNRTLDNPTNMKDGGTYILRVIQDATGSRTLDYGANYLWPAGVAPTLTTTAAGIDILTFLSDGTYMYGIASLSFG